MYTSTVRPSEKSRLSDEPTRRRTRYVLLRRGKVVFPAPAGRPDLHKHDVACPVRADKNVYKQRHNTYRCRTLHLSIVIRVSVVL